MKGLWEGISKHGQGNSSSDDDEEDEDNFVLGGADFVHKQKISRFIKLLQEILNPTSENSLKMDSVFQMRNLVRTYYEKKGHIQQHLADKLFVMLVERPQMMKFKKKHFFKTNEMSEKMTKQLTKIRNVYFELE